MANLSSLEVNLVKEQEVELEGGGSIQADLVLRNQYNIPPEILQYLLF